MQLTYMHTSTSSRAEGSYILIVGTFTCVRIKSTVHKLGLITGTFCSTQEYRSTFSVCGRPSFTIYYKITHNHGRSETTIEVPVYPSCLQTTVAASTFHAVSATVPHFPPKQISTLPNELDEPPVSLTSPVRQTVHCNIEIQ